MPTVSEIQVEADFEVLTPKKPWPEVALELLRKEPLGAAGGAIVVLMILMAIFANFLTVYNPEANDLQYMLTPPDDQFWLGTDQFGRDLLTRIIYGARTALLVGFTCAIIGSTFGLVLGVASAYFGGWFDLITQRIVDVIMAFPLIILALAVVATLGPGTQNVIIAITIPFIPRCARVVRSSACADSPRIVASVTGASAAMRSSARRTIPAAGFSPRNCAESSRIRAVVSSRCASAASRISPGPISSSR